MAEHAMAAAGPRLPSVGLPARPRRVGLMIRAVIVVIAVAGCSGTGSAALSTLGELLRQDSEVSTYSQNDPHFDGALGAVVEASHLGGLAQVQASLTERLGQAGYTLTCPAASDDPVPAGQQITTEPRVTCAVGGHGVAGTVWLGTTAGDGVQLSAVIGVS